VLPTLGSAVFASRSSSPIEAMSMAPLYANSALMRPTPREAGLLVPRNRLEGKKLCAETLRVSAEDRGGGPPP
jgi:hypothetical protein